MLCSPIGLYQIILLLTILKSRLMYISLYLPSSYNWLDGHDLIRPFVMWRMVTTPRTLCYLSVVCTMLK